MAISVCMMSDGSIPVQALSARLAECGFAVWPCASPSRYIADPKRAETVCLIVAMRGEAAVARMEFLRLEGVGTPAILVVADKADVPGARLADAHVLDVLEMPVDMRGLLAWLECICVALEYGRRVYVPENLDTEEQPKRATG